MNTLESYQIQQELAEIAPTLAALPKRNHHVVPENYFDDVEEVIFSQLKLSDLKRKKVSVPDQYFEGLEDKILGTVNNNAKVKTFTIQRWVRYAAAASVVVVLSAVAFKYFSINTAPNQMADSLEVNDYLQYLQQNVEDGDIEMMIDNGLVEESDLTVVEIPSDESKIEEAGLFETELDF